MADDSVVDATRFAGLAKALNRVFGWALPTAFPGSDLLTELWTSIPVEVTEAPEPGVRYRARALEPIRIAPAPALSGIAFAEVRDAADGDASSPRPQ